MILSTIKDRGGKLRFGEKVIRNDFAPLKTYLTDSTSYYRIAYCLKMCMCKVIVFFRGTDNDIIRVCNEGEGETKTQKILMQDIPKERRKNAALRTTKPDICNSGNERTRQRTEARA
jgi:hypothetical protein